MVIMWRRWRKRVLYLLYVVIIVVVALEVGVRIWGYSGHYIYDPIYMPFEAAAEIPFVHQPNLEQARARGLAVIDTDALGLRALEPGTTYGPKQAGEYRIAIAGDSITFGEGVERTEDTFCAVLAQKMNAMQEVLEVTVFNFGVSAYSVREIAATLPHRMLAVEPDLVIMNLIPSDFDLSRTPTVDKYGYNYNQKLSGFMARDSWLKNLLRKMHLTYVVRDLTARWSRKRGVSAAEDKIATELPAGFSYVRQFAATAQEHGIEYLIVLLPTAPDKTYGQVKEQLIAENLAYLDLTAIRQEFTREDYMASRFDRHPSAAVHRRIGEELVNAILIKPYAGSGEGK
jgi:hypothetical protein